MSEQQNIDYKQSWHDDYLKWGRETLKIYNPHIHHRRSIRLKGYDYTQAGLYFITICCQDRIFRFGHIENDEMILNKFGKIAYDEWLKLPKRFPNFELDVFQIMPNHFHGIIALVGATLAVAPNNHNNIAPNHDVIAQNEMNMRAGFTPAQNVDNPNNDIGATARVAPTIPNIVGAYKSLVANGCLNIFKSKNEIMGKLWQRNYYEHIIRNEQSYQRISEYIINNPIKWTEDKFYTK